MIIDLKPVFNSCHVTAVSSASEWHFDRPSCTNHSKNMIGGELDGSHCVVPEKIHTHPMEGHWKFLGGRHLKSQNVRSKV